MRINRDKATPCRFEIGERRLIISPPFQPFETEVHKKKKVEKQGKNQCLNQSTFPSLTEIRGKRVWVACETTRFSRKMDSIAEKG